MSTASDTVAAALSRLANDHRRASTNYLNISARAGTRTPRRLMSDVGFLTECQFTYANPHRANFSYNDTEDPREIKQIVIAGYGLLSDYNRLISSDRAARLLRDASPNGHPGVSPYPGSADLLMSGSLDANTYAGGKTRATLHALTSTGGPSPHFVVDRKGNVIVGPGLDAETTYIPDYMDAGVFIAIESALVISREDHAARRYDRIMEQPLTPLLLTSLGVLVNKLLVALGSEFPRQFVSALGANESGFTYVWRNSSQMQALRPWNFQDPTPESLIPNSGLNYASSTPATFFEIAASQGEFDLGTQIWRPLAAPTPVAGREEVRQALDAVDTAGEESAQMGSYVSISAGERSNEMQAVTRRQMFVVRHRAAVNDAEGASEHAAAAASEVGASGGLPTEVPASFEPHTYNFHTGQWGAPDPLTNSTTT